mmetsp:Transcript_87017/g.151428  ORF Transcript_87017/g.151428 Transcript_87017/m.151428 type:complete len:240 (+) Transcript_87017:3473-4192(+)
MGRPAVGFARARLKVGDGYAGRIANTSLYTPEGSGALGQRVMCADGPLSILTTRQTVARGAALLGPKRTCSPLRQGWTEVPPTRTAHEELGYASARYVYCPTIPKLPSMSTFVVCSCTALETVYWGVLLMKMNPRGSVVSIVHTTSPPGSYWLVVMHRATTTPPAFGGGSNVTHTSYGRSSSSVPYAPVGESHVGSASSFTCVLHEELAASDILTSSGRPRTAGPKVKEGRAGAARTSK